MVYDHFTFHLRHNEQCEGCSYKFRQLDTERLEVTVTTMTKKQMTWIDGFWLGSCTTYRMCKEAQRDTATR